MGLHHVVQNLLSVIIFQKSFFVQCKFENKKGLKIEHLYGDHIGINNNTRKYLH